MSDRTIARIRDLLEDERKAVMAADFDALAAIAERKEALFGELDAQKLPAESVRALRLAAERNGELLAAAARGVKSVIRRVSEVRSANGPLKTYGQDGAQRTFGDARGSFEKRA